MRNAFLCELDLTGQHIALPDDVMTTGSSMSALAQAVQHAGAHQVSAWVIARTLKQAEPTVRMSLRP